MKKLICVLAIGMSLFVTAQKASAQLPYGNQNPFNAGVDTPLFKRLFVRQPLPAFQAAPWYLYWPYNAHFMTPAPLGLGAPYYNPGAGSAGGFGGQTNPYFPMQMPHGPAIK